MATNKTHRPYVEILFYAIERNHYLSASLLKEVSELPEIILHKIV
jgi:hypothetical protein